MSFSVLPLQKQKEYSEAATNHSYAGLKRSYKGVFNLETQVMELMEEI